MTRQPVALLYRALFPPPMPSSERGKALWRVLQLRAAMAWAERDFEIDKWMDLGRHHQAARMELLLLRNRVAA